MFCLLNKMCEGDGNIFAGSTNDQKCLIAQKDLVKSGFVSTYMFHCVQFSSSARASCSKDWHKWLGRKSALWQCGVLWSTL